MFLNVTRVSEYVIYFRGNWKTSVSLVTHADKQVTALEKSKVLTNE